MKILTMETKAQNAAGSDSSILADSNNLTLDEIMNHLIKDNAEPSLLNVEPAINSVDWRIQLPPDSRQKNINKLMETLKKHVPYSWQEGIEELGRIAISFEELIFNTALNQELAPIPTLEEGADVTEPALLQNVAAEPEGIAAITSSVAAPSPEADGTFPQREEVAAEEADLAGNASKKARVE